MSSKMMALIKGNKMSSLVKRKVNEYLEDFVHARDYQIKIYAPYVADENADTSRHEHEMAWYKEVIEMLVDIQDAANEF
mgnify:CR=1 FL=1